MTTYSWKKILSVNICAIKSSINLFFPVAHILSVLSTADPETQYDTLVYISGSIKLLASNPQLRDKLIDSECIKAVADCLKKCTEVCYAL